ncbi:MAG: lipoate--protein ligase family protein [Lentisphaerae bacterium]|nr:lipoate--protein ligase family protein [Lentisphaerota bacterium]
MSKEQWLCWMDGIHDPYFNMAMDEVLLANSALQQNQVLVRVYRWDRPSVSFGSAQIMPEELADKYTLVRRPTGGGVVYHDVDLTYTVVVPPEHKIMQLDRMESYKIFHEALLIKMQEDGVEALLESHGTDHVDRSTMQCFVSPSRFDLVAPSGSKYAGAAQRRTRCGILHQGSIKLEAAGGDWDKLCAELLESLKIKFDIEFQDWQPAQEVLLHAEELGQIKYSTEAWNRHHEFEAK